ncbi:hypothetical protein EAH89_17325 [Roseomonas nepalensis]|uniref:Uncharacterized protein n=1 Tax=Muricoccus nepalensis TaxID=1854500 RepID=A0A502FV62_9PROT|nr:hypothetical protein EAH89_17325 [Roseomonas nepalensis]
MSTLPLAPAALGVPGFGTNGDPAAGLQASIFDAHAFNTIQEELMALLTEGGITPDNSGVDLKQVLAAVRNVTLNRIKSSTFLTSGTWTPDPGMRVCLIRCVGGGAGGGGAVGGAGGSAGGGGGAGAYGERWFNRTEISATHNVTVGAPGGGGNGPAGLNGVAGGFTTVSGLIIASGGAFGGAGQTGAVGGRGIGGDSTGGLVNVSGGSGTPGMLVGGSGVGGAGGSSMFGQGGVASFSYDPAGTSGTGFGAGGAGGGAGSSPKNGGVGTAGVALIVEFCRN